MWTALLLATALAAAGEYSSSQNAHDKAVLVHEEARKAVKEGKDLLKDLQSLRSRYGAGMDAAAVRAERDALLLRITAVQARYHLHRRELNALRKENQHGQLVRLLSGLPREQFAAGLLEANAFNRFYGDIDGYTLLVDNSLKEDAAAFAHALLEAEEALQRRVLAGSAAAVALVVVIALAVFPTRRKVVVLPPKPDVKRLE